MRLNFLKLFFKEKVANVSDFVDDTAEYLPWHKKKNIFRKILRFLFKLVIIFVFLFIVTCFFYVKSWQIIITNSLAGKNNLEQGIGLLSKKDLVGSKSAFVNAVQNFDTASINIEIIETGPLGLVPIFSGQLLDAKHFVNSLRLLANSGEDIVNIADNFKIFADGRTSKNFSDLSVAEKKDFLKSITNSQVELTKAKQDLDSSLSEFKQADSWLLNILGGSALTELASNLESGAKAFGQILPLANIVPSLVGYPEAKDYLIIFQNYDELRPTGGFIGTYGLLSTNAGDITKLETRDIYHIDMPASGKLKIDPPAPLKEYLKIDQWYMRDANWSPDWPASANNILKLFKAESQFSKKEDTKLEFDGVIAITPDFITRLLELTGPVKIENKVYDKTNFTKVLEERVEIDYRNMGISEWDRKQVVGQITAELKNRLFNLPPKDWPKLIDSIYTSLMRKDVLIYANGSQKFNSLLADQGWLGQIRQDSSDYLMVVDANLAALKTDAVMKRQISYKIEPKGEQLLAKVDIVYQHTDKKFDFKTTRYRSYTRVYVPENSWLVNSSGNDSKFDFGKEFNRTWFGTFISIEPGETKTLHLEYLLPKTVIKDKKYSLVIQRQPGTRLPELKFDLRFDNAIKSNLATGLDTINITSGDTVNFKGLLDVDKKVELVF